MMELPKCNAETFQIFLDQMSKDEPDELKIMVLDNGAFHKAKTLIIPGDIVLLFLPPYSPELNPAEKMWAKFKRTFTNRSFHTLESLSEFIYEEAKTIDETLVKSTCAYSYIFDGNFWTI